MIDNYEVLDNEKFEDLADKDEDLDVEKKLSDLLNKEMRKSDRIMKLKIMNEKVKSCVEKCLTILPKKARCKKTVNKKIA